MDIDSPTRARTWDLRINRTARFRCIYGLRTQSPDSRQAESILMQQHVPSRSEAICRYADGLVRANIDAYGCDERVRRQQS